MNFRAGIGYDVHKLVLGRKLIIGGVYIPYEKGLLGHSDADVLVHSIIDSILGAIKKGDIGTNFPDSSSEFKDISSLILLKNVAEILKNENYCISNIDSVIIAQNPKMKSFIPKMEKNIANSLGISLDQVSVKATTEEELGFTGSGEGIASKAISIVYKKS